MVGSASASSISEAKSTEAELPSSMNTVATVPLSTTESMFWLSVLSNTLDRSTVADAPFSMFTVSVESTLRTTEVISWSSVLSNKELTSTEADVPFSMFTVIVESPLSTTDVIF